MDRFARVILGYHGCEREFADALLTGEMEVKDWKPSTNPYDWLGRGIYFWEHAPDRARSWSELPARRRRPRAAPSVIGAVIHLGTCLDFTDVGYTALLGRQHAALELATRLAGDVLPENKGLRGDLDCLVINDLVDTLRESGLSFQTVRSPFLEGEPAFPGSRILKESHIQVAVIDPTCILGVFRPAFTD